MSLLFVNTKRIGVQRHAAAFHVFAKAKTFHFCAEDILASCSLLSAQKFHVRSKGAQLRLMIIVPLRRTSGCSVTLPGQASIRVRGRATELRAGLDGKDAGNACCIIESFLLFTSRSHITHTYAGQALLRVRGRAMKLRVILDKGAAGNTCRIVKAHLLKSARKGALSHAPV